jgi:hypothetical protein
MVALPELDGRLVAYALAAGAALAPAASANGIIYVGNPTPTTLTVSGAGSFGSLPFSVSGLPGLPGTTTLFSFVFKGFSYGPGGGAPPSLAGLALLAYAQPSNLVLNRGGFVANMAPGSYIGCSCAASTSFSPAGFMMTAFAADASYGGPHLDGPWANKIGIMGFSFGTSSSSYFFGWARFQVTADTSPSITVTLLDYAYRDEPFVGINAGDAPEPGTLGLLALGFAGMAAWRARRKAA